MSEPEDTRGGQAGDQGKFAWRAFFQQTTRPLFVLGSSRRIRFVNAAWEELTGQKAEAVRGLVCSRRRHSTALAAALAPTPEALAGRPDRVRRPAPHARPGTQWWDIHFLPLPSAQGLYGWLGSIEVIGEKATGATRKLPAFLAEIRARHADAFRWEGLEGDETRLQLWVSQLRHAAAVEAPLWLVGPAGSGKETTARIVHSYSPRRLAAFVALDCAGLQPYLVEALLFAPGNVLEGGHAGTIYLKSPQLLPRDLQQQIAELAQNLAGSVRWMVGTDRPALELTTAGLIVPELATTLAILEIHIPPLSVRWPCLSHWLQSWCARSHVSEEVVELLQAWPWQRGLRELRQVLEQAHLRAQDQPLQREHLPLALRLHAEHAPVVQQPIPLPSLDTILQAVERQLIELALRQCRYNQTAAAERLGIPRNRLLRRIEALGLSVPPETPKS
ncbi:MAG: sigma 54-interacting transcriptional regulator [Gemmataceae bacterium]|nr:sigma 54-interacting transcriptional regulator [Gemmataceae bacterium]